MPDPEGGTVSTLGRYEHEAGPSSLTTSHPKRIFLVGFVFGQVLEVLRAALDELVQGLLCTHQLLQLLPQLLLLPRPGGVFKSSPAPVTEQPFSVSLGPQPGTPTQGLLCRAAQTM